MTIQETHALLSMAFAQFDKKNVMNEIKQLWFDQIKDFEFEHAKEIMRVVLQRTSFPPTIGDFFKVVEELRISTEETWAEGWDLFQRLYQKYYHSDVMRFRRELQEQNEIAYAAISTMLSEYRQLQTSELATFRAQFRQRYEVLQRKGRAQAATGGIRRLLLTGGAIPEQETLPAWGPGANTVEVCRELIRSTSGKLGEVRKLEGIKGGK